MSKPMKSFTGEILNIDDIVIYLNNECKFIGQIIGFVDTKVKICRLSPPNVFVTPKETQDYGEVNISPDDVVGIIISKSDKDMTKRLVQVNKLVYKYETELEFMRKIIQKHGLEFELDKGKIWN